MSLAWASSSSAAAARPRAASPPPSIASAFASRTASGPSSVRFPSPTPADDEREQIRGSPLADWTAPGPEETARWQPPCCGDADAPEAAHAPGCSDRAVCGTCQPLRTVHLGSPSGEVVLNAEEPRRAPDIVQAEGEASLFIPADDSKEAGPLSRSSVVVSPTPATSSLPPPPPDALRPKPTHDPPRTISLRPPQAVSASAEIARRLREWNPFCETALLDIVLALRGAQAARRGAGAALPAASPCGRRPWAGRSGVEVARGLL